MSRGKHGRKADLRRQEQERQAVEREKRRLAAEEDARARLDADIAEMEALAVEISTWREKVALVSKAEMDEVRAEVAELVRYVASLEEEDRRATRRGERDHSMDGIGIDFMEATMEHIRKSEDKGDPEYVIAVGVDPHTGKKLTVEQVKAIQRARGLRR